MSGFIGSAKPYLDGPHLSDVRLTAVFPYSNGLGSCLHFHDSEGRLLVWFTKRRVTIEVGERIRASFVVKSHLSYEGTEQNITKSLKILERL